MKRHICSFRKSGRATGFETFETSAAGGEGLCLSTYPVELRVILFDVF